MKLRSKGNEYTVYFGHNTITFNSLVEALKFIWNQMR